MAAKKKRSKGKRAKVEIDADTLRALIRAAEALADVAAAAKARVDGAPKKTKKKKKKKKK
jgi:hypothetical protein